MEQDDYGATPIHDAAEQGQLKCLHVFYSHSVDLNYRDCDGLTPLWVNLEPMCTCITRMVAMIRDQIFLSFCEHSDFAMEKGHQECVEFLKNPQKAFDTAKKQHRGAKVSDNWVNLCIAKPLPVKHADD